MKQKVSRIIRHSRSKWNLQTQDAGALTYKCAADARDFFGRIPRGPYRVTYFLHARGRYRVCAAGYIVRHQPQYGFHICFLPQGWMGQRVARRVEVL